MTQGLTGVVKKDRVRPGEPCRIGAPSAAPAPRRAAVPHARIVEKTDDRAIVEVRCGCGQVLHVECRWAGGGEAAAEQETRRK
jgi:hypothetical protein